MSRDLAPEERTSSPDVERWDVVLRPQAAWLDLHLRDLWRYRDLVLLFVRRDFVAQYKQTILGPLWFVLQPLLATLVFTVVFGAMAGLSTDGLPKLLFYLSGQIVWGYFAGVLNSTSTTFVSNAHLFGKVYFPRLAVPVSIMLSEMIQFGLRLAFFACFWVWFYWDGSGIHPTSTLWLLPVLMAIMAALALGLGIIFSALTTKYRDLRFLLTFGIQLLMYTTPAIFPLSSLHGNYRLIMLVNPMTPIIEAFRYATMGVGTCAPLHLMYSLAFSVIVLFVGVMLFTRVERNFMDTV